MVEGVTPDSPDRSGRQARKPRNHWRNRGFLLSPVASVWIRPSDSAQEPEFPAEIGARCPRNDNSSGKSGLTGRPQARALAASAAHDLEGADALLPDLAAGALIADKAVDAEERVLKPLAEAGRTAVIPPKGAKLKQF